MTHAGIHNPTGATLSAVTAHRLLKLAESANIVIVEDDVFSDFETNPAPRLAALDGLSRVIHVGSFSKTLSAAFRCGYIAARPDWLNRLIDLKIATSFGGGQLASAVVLTVLTDGGYRKHMETVRNKLEKARSKTMERLKEIGITPWVVPQAGMFIWCQLPDGLDEAKITRLCLEQGVVLAPGNVFSYSGAGRSFLRFNASQSDELRIFEVVAAAMGSMV